MYRNNPYNQNYYRQYPYPYMNQPCYACPLMQNNYDTYDNYEYYEPIYEDLFRGELDEEFLLEERAFKMSKENIDNVAAAVKKESHNAFKDIEKFIKDTRLLDYMLMALITYICNNYQKYEHVIDQKTDELVEEMKKNLPWLFDMLKVVGVTPAMVDKFLDNLIKLTVMNIKKLMPAGL
jgi:hypothetical protein